MRTDRGRYIPELDGIRGLAISLVLVHHFTRLEPIGTAETALHEAARLGWVGVDLFFVLSGFLITGILLDAKDREGYFRTFYARRALRILPLYYGVLLAALAAVPLLAHVDPGAARALVERQGWYWTHTVNVLIASAGVWRAAPFESHHFWSLAVEEQFYLVWPLAVFLLPPGRLKRLCVWLLVAAPILRVSLAFAGVPGRALFVLAPTRVDALALGAWIAVVAREPGGVERLARLVRPALAASAVVLLSLLLSEGGINRYRLRMQAVGFTAVALLGGALLAHAIALRGTRGPRSGGLAGRVWRSSALRALGKYSYAIYVLHMPLRYALERSGHGVTFWGSLAGSPLAGQGIYLLLGFAMSFALAWASWHAWEKHWLRLKDRVPYGREAETPRRAPALTPAGAD